MMCRWHLADTAVRRTARFVCALYSLEGTGGFIRTTSGRRNGGIRFVSRGSDNRGVHVGDWAHCTKCRANDGKNRRLSQALR